VRIGVNGRFLAAVQTGVQRFALEITRRLLPHADVVLLTPRGARVPEALAGAAEVASGRLRGHAWEQIELPELARRAGADVCLGLANALPASGGPHAVVLHDATVFEHPEWFTARYALWHRRVLLPAARRAAVVGTLSRSAAASLAPVLGRPAEDIAVVPQGAAPLDAPASPSDVADARHRFGLGGAYLLATGAGDPRKNVSFLEEVLAEWRRRREAPPPALVVVGSAETRVFGSSAVAGGGPDARRSAAPAKAPGAPSGGPHTLRTGRVDDRTLRALYTGASVFCFPSLAEGFGRPPLEALACGTPAVVAPYGPAREVLGDAAEIVPLRPAAWLDALERLVASGPPAVFAERARAAVARHRWEDGVDATLALCARAAESGAAAHAAISTTSARARAPLPTPRGPR
jgi:glycosyltransferase involved in cell wall biosynthesis